MNYFQLKATGLTSNKLAYTNAVFVHPSTQDLIDLESKSTNYVEIKGNDYNVAVYEVRPSDGAEKGTIGMNGLQRKLLNISNGLTIEARPFKFNRTRQSNLLKIKFLLKTIKRNDRVIVEENDIVEFIFKRFPDHLFSNSQILIVDYQGSKYSLQVEDLELATFGDLEEKEMVRVPKDRGVLKQDYTFIEVVPDKANRLLTFKAANNASRLNILSPSFNFQQMGIGGLNTEFKDIFRRAFATRALDPALIEKLQIKHTRGLLLYGPPGTGKTLIARQIGKMLNGRKPKIVNGPEILSKMVGESEKNIRDLFVDAEKDYAENKENSDLHIIIFDEMDAICKQRGSTNNGTGVHDTIVNQLLSKLDGVDSLNNILVIGMTNRKDLIDSALLRPGRIAVHVEIGLPNEEGRYDILKIHTALLEKHGMLGEDVDLKEIAALTKNYSGAEIEGVVKSARSTALSEQVENFSGGQVSLRKMDIKVTRKHFNIGLQDIRPAFGMEEDVIANCLRNGIISYGKSFEKSISLGNRFIRQIKTSESTSLLSVLLSGKMGSGKTAIAAHLASTGAFPFVKLIAPKNLIGKTDFGKAKYIAKVFEDAYRSPMSLIIIDNIERLLEYVRIGPRFSNTVLQSLLVYIRQVPPNPESKLMIIGTTSNMGLMSDLMIKQSFQVDVQIPQVNGGNEVANVISDMNLDIDDIDLEQIRATADISIGIKPLMLVLDMAAQYEDGKVTFKNFMNCLTDYGI